jgi:predicted ATPase
MPRLSLSFLGDYRVALDERPVSELAYDKVRALLAYLAVEADRPHRREALAGLLWPDSPEAAARRNLSQALYKLRQAIADLSADPPYLLVTTYSVQFNPESDYQLDVASFAAGVAVRDLATQEQAARLYRGPFLQGFLLADSEAFEEWTLVQRESLHRQALEALGRLAEHSLAQGATPAALRWAERQLQLDPWREEAHRQLMRALALSGRRSDALAQYETCRKLLADELGVAPGAETQALYQQIKEGGLTGSAALAGPASAVAPLVHLPSPLTLFVGRERELAELDRLLAQTETRLVTLTGPGGMGKTRLAISAAQRQAERQPHGAAFVALQAVAAPGEIVTAIGSAVGLIVSDQAAPKAQLLAWLRDRQMLLVLDNFEHLLEGADLVMELLEGAPGLRLVATSREAMNLAGEWAFDVSGLGAAATALFRQSARRVRADFQPSAAEEEAIERICRLVDGMPLAVELAAAWVRTLTCSEIAAELERSLGILTTQARNVPERHRSLAAVCEYSWKLLSEGEARALRWLAVFRGGFGREAAEAAAGAGLGTLAGLVAKSLVRRTDAGARAARYDLHEFVRRFAFERLEAAGERAAAGDAHLNYLLRLTEQSAGHLYGAGQGEWLNHWAQEHDNLRSALSWAFEAGPPAPERVGKGLRLISRLDRFWQGHGHLREGAGWLARGLGRAAGVAPGLRAEALNTLGWLQNQLNLPDEASRALSASLALYREAGDRAGEASALDGLGDMAWAAGDFERARAAYAESLRLRRELGDPVAVGLSLYSLGRLYVDHDETMWQRTALAEPLLREALALLEAQQDARGTALALNALGRLALFEGRPGEAAAPIRAALERFAALGNAVDIAECLEELAQIAAAEGNAARAARICGAAEALREHLGVPAQPHHTTFVQTLRRQVAEATWAGAWAEGRRLSQAEAVEAALGGNGLP